MGGDGFLADLVEGRFGILVIEEISDCDLPSSQFLLCLGNSFDGEAPVHAVLGGLGHKDPESEAPRKPEVLGEDIGSVIKLFNDPLNFLFCFFRDSAPFMDDPVNRPDGNTSPFGDLFDIGNISTSYLRIVYVNVKI